MSKDKLTEKEILDKLEGAFFVNSEVYIQLKEIVGEHFKSDISWEKSKITHDEAKDMIKSLVNQQQQKPTVTRKWIAQYAWDILTDYLELPKSSESENMEKRLTELLKELGITIED